MHYAYQFTVEPSHTASSPLEESLKLGSGILKRVQIFFPDGCSKLVKCCLWNNWEQLAPTNPDGYYALDGAAADAALYYDMDEDTNQLWFIAWTVGSKYNHEITIHLEVQGRDEPDPFKIMTLMKDTINRLIDLMRSVL